MLQEIRKLPRAVAWIVSDVFSPDATSVRGFVIADQNGEGGPRQGMDGKQVELVQIQLDCSIELALGRFKSWK
jgi:hypothetical protein